MRIERMGIEMTLSYSTDRILFWYRSEHTLLTGNQPRTRRNTLYLPEINSGHSGTHSADRKTIIDVVEHTLLTGIPPKSQIACGPLRGLQKEKQAIESSTKRRVGPSEARLPRVFTKKLSFLHAVIGSQQQKSKRSISLLSNANMYFYFWILSILDIKGLLQKKVHMKKYAYSI